MATTSLSWDVVSVEKPDDVNVVIGQAHFIKTVEDLCWSYRRLGLLDFDPGLVAPLSIVERGFELGGRDVAEVAV